MIDNKYSRLYIDGRWVAAASDDVIRVVNPTSEEVIATVPDGAAADVATAVSAAHAAFPSWSALPVVERADWLRRIGACLVKRRATLIGTIIHEVGTPRDLTERVQVDAAIATFDSTASLSGQISFSEHIGDSLILRVPLGVVGAITPWNYPLLQIAYKIAPAIVAGCTVVLKPSEVTPLNAFILAEAIDEAGLPAGVFNLVSGRGAVAGESLAAHPDVDIISFTGSTRAGRRVAELAAASIKKVTLELGGKSPHIFLDDLEGEALARAVDTAIAGAFPNSGQNCGALTRLLVPRTRLREVEQLAVQAAEALTVGNPEQPGISLGPLVSAAQQERVRGYIRRGIEEGGTLLTGGCERPSGLDAGYFVAPTVFTDITPEMTIAREEIFGPVMVILPYEDDDQAVRLANDTEYGLSAKVQGADPVRAQAIASRVRAGQVMVNEGRRTIDTPFGGFKRSGYGRECGRYGIEEFLTTKALHLPPAAVPSGP